MFISTTTLTSSPSDLTAVGQKQEACSSIGLLARQSPSDRPLTTPSSTTLSMAIRQPNWSEADTLLGQFSPVDTTDCPVGPCDCGSIMHYGATSYSVDGVKPTITVNNTAICTNIGQRIALSTGDVAAARVMYDSVKGLKSKITLTDTSDNGPALSFHDNALF